ncbi:DUF2927 domain-containing protein [Roseicyclus sp.]|uniref:DUF2927 domain-containing protein n=1 Tax=Roseicyclus sp. TaxID=1914329 RepID=UPI001BCF9930|nr:DUF2927 domain-containing protein [Roseicyclus sp.]
MRQAARSLIICAAAFGLSACMVQTGPQTPPTADPGDGAGYVQSPESAALARYYTTIEARLVADGLLRSDGGVTDAPYTAETLAANFERIALYDEYILSGGRFIQRETPAQLRRWEVPVQLQAHFGASVDALQQAEDLSILSTYARRLSRASGHPVITVPEGGNFHVLYLDRDEQRAAGDLLRRLLPGIGQETINEIQNMPRSTFCAVFAFSEHGARPVYRTAIAIIRSEHPSLLRRSCVHEEVAQGLGLPNDSPRARPSIFNDDEEFSLLTPHDEALLRILYDPRLTPGLTPEAARPMVRIIAEELMGGSS